METSFEMSEVLLWELRFLELSLVMGMFLRSLYDLLIVFRRLVHHGTIWTGVEDLLYCCFCGLSIFTLFYYENQGAPRGFAVVGIALGMAIYHFGPSRLVCRLLEWVLGVLAMPVKICQKFFKKCVKKC